MLSYFRVLLSLHSPQNGKKGTEWVLLSISSAIRFNEGKRNATLCGMHIKTLCTVEFKEGGRTVEGERKENEGGKCFEIFLGSLSDSIFA